jgi:hypothetical protein
MPFPCGASSFALTQKKQKVKAPIGFLTLRGLEKPATCKLARWSATRKKFALPMFDVRKKSFAAQTVQVA